MAGHCGLCSAAIAIHPSAHSYTVNSGFEVASGRNRSKRCPRFAATPTVCSCIHSSDSVCEVPTTQPLPVRPRLTRPASMAAAMFVPVRMSLIDPGG